MSAALPRVVIDCRFCSEPILLLAHRRQRSVAVAAQLVGCALPQCRHAVDDHRGPEGSCSIAGCDCWRLVVPRFAPGVHVSHRSSCSGRAGGQKGSTR